MAKTITPFEPEGSIRSAYNGVTGEATFTVNEKVYGPVKVSITDYHVLNDIMDAMRREGRLAAAHGIKRDIDTFIRALP